MKILEHHLKFNQHSIKIKENQWKSLKIQSTSLKSLEIHWKQWKSLKIIENKRKSKKINEHLWTSMDINTEPPTLSAGAAVPRRMASSIKNFKHLSIRSPGLWALDSLKTNENSIKIDEHQWKTLKVNGNPWKSLKKGNHWTQLKIKETNVGGRRHGRSP